jgi:hypothetical protein
MRTLAAITVVLLPSLVLAQPLSQPKPIGPGGSCPHGYTSCGSFCVPRAGAQDAIPLPPNGSCPWGWTRSGSVCLRSGRSALIHRHARGFRLARELDPDLAEVANLTW